MKKLLAASAVFVLSACGGEQPTSAPEVSNTTDQSEIVSALTASYEAILNENFTLAGGSEAQVEEVVALLPDTMKLTVGSSSFNAASGATIWNDVSLTGAENENVGLKAKEVKLWGLNTDGIAARAAGTNLDETVRFAQRIEAAGLTTQGLDVLMSDWMVAYIEGVSQTIQTFAPEDGVSDEELAEMRAAMEMVVADYNVEIERAVAIGPKMRPWEIARIDPDTVKAEPDKTALLVLQESAAYLRTFGVDHLVWTGTEFSMDMEQDGIRQTVEGAYSFVGYSGWNGGDIDSSAITGMYFSQDMDMREALLEDGLAEEEIPEMFEKIRVGYSIESGTFTGMKFDNVLRYVAMGEWPPTTHTDLMAYGRFDMQDFDMSFNDIDLFTVDGMVIDFSDWHWFVPSGAEISFTGLNYNIEGFFDLIASLPEVQSDEEFEIMNQVMDIGQRYEAFPIIYDASYIWDWNPETGAFSFKAPQKHHNFGQAEFEISGVLPNFEESVAAAREDLAYQPDPNADIWEARYRQSEFEKLFEERFAVTRGYLMLDDQGGLNKLFPLISEIGKLNPDEAGPMIANSTPEALRQAAVSGIGLAAIEAGKEMPQAENWIMPFADWVRDGGKFTVKIDPTEPLGAHLEEKYPDPDPDQIVEILGITVTHETP